MDGYPLLYITDGTTRVDLLSDTGFYLLDWTPAKPQLKGGGTWQSSPLSDGRRLVDRRYDNVLETFVVGVKHDSQDLLIRECQRIDALLVKAMDYWVRGWTNPPVYLVARGPRETEARYVVIHAYSLPTEDNPYAGPFYTRFCAASEEDLTLVIERGHWLSAPPGTSEATCIAAQQDYNGITFGRGATGCTLPLTPNSHLLKEDGDHILLEDGSSFILLEDGTGELVDEWYVAARHNRANLTHIYWYDDSITTFSAANLVGEATPFAFMPATIEDLDSVYFGIDETVADSGPFGSLVFDISTKAVYTGTGHMQWEYYNGAAWAALTVQDNTELDKNQRAYPFSVEGVNSVHWQQPTDMAATAINGVTAYWVRAIASITGGDTISTPEQGGRDIYAICWPSVLIAADDITGDMPALGRIQVHAQSDNPSWVTALYVDQVVMGTRRTSRGADFTAYLNFSDDQNPAGVTVQGAAPDTWFADDMSAATGRYLLYAPGAIRTMAHEASIALDATMAPQYRGIYHVYLRCDQNGGAAGDIGVRLHTVLDSLNGTLGEYTDTKYLTSLSDWQFIDFGRLVLPPSGVEAGGAMSALYIAVECSCTNAAAILKLYDLVLMPVDEWSGNICENITPSSLVGAPLQWRRYVDADSVSYPKATLTDYVKHSQTHAIETAYTPYAVGPLELVANAEQRVWFFFAQAYGGTTLPRKSKPGMAASIRVYRAQRYLGMRGQQ